MLRKGSGFVLAGAVANALLGCTLTLMIFFYTVWMHSMKASQDKDNDGQVDGFVHLFIIR
jgi:4-hydroxybenzoate polyprenyltransferase